MLGLTPALPARFFLDLLKTPLIFPTGEGDRLASLAGGMRPPVLLRVDRLERRESDSTDSGRLDEKVEDLDASSNGCTSRL